MSKPKTVPTPNPQTIIDQGNIQSSTAQTNTMGQNTIGQDNPYGSLSYTTTIDPITGKPKYQANAQYSPEQQYIFDILQSNQTGIGTTANDAIANVFSQYGGDPNLVGQAGSLTNQALNQQLPSWERFDAPARDQLRTQLINQGLVEGSPAYQQQMDKLTQQQDLDRGKWLSDFQPKAYAEAADQYGLPLANVAKMLGLSQPGSLPGQILNTPTANYQPVDANAAYKTSQDAVIANNAANNAYWNNILGAGAKVGAAALAIPTGGASLAVDAMGNSR